MKEHKEYWIILLIVTIIFTPLILKTFYSHNEISEQEAYKTREHKLNRDKYGNVEIIEQKDIIIGDQK